jgi:predicted nucleic acid-binding protein
MYDDLVPEFQEQAVRVFEHLVRQGRAALSVQCLTEFFNTATRSTDDLDTVSNATRRLNQLATAAIVYPITVEIVQDAVAAASRHQMSIWDALIWSVAFRNGIPVIVTEDMQSRTVIAGVRYVNPFDPDFDLDSL